MVELPQLVVISSLLGTAVFAHSTLALQIPSSPVNSEISTFLSQMCFEATFHFLSWFTNAALSFNWLIKLTEERASSSLNSQAVAKDSWVCTEIFDINQICDLKFLACSGSLVKIIFIRKLLYAIKTLRNYSNKSMLYYKKSAFENKIFEMFRNFLQEFRFQKCLLKWIWE